MNNQIEKIAKIWPGIQNIFSVPHNQKEYKRLVHILDGLIDEVGEDEGERAVGDRARDALALEQFGHSDTLDRLAEPHVVGQAAAEAELAQFDVTLRGDPEILRTLGPEDFRVEIDGEPFEAGAGDHRRPGSGPGRG